MKHLLDLDNWDRKEHFEFFRQFGEPFFGVSVNVDVTKAYQKAKANSYSVYLYYLHCILKAANDIEPFRYRIQDDQVYVYDHIHLSATVDRPNGTFGFSHTYFKPEFEAFAVGAKLEIDRVRAAKSIFPPVSGDEVIHFSALPWFSFNGLSHARSFKFKDSCPKVSVGKIIDEHGKKTMSVSVHVNHALMDGLHVGQYIAYLQKLLDGE